MCVSKEHQRRIHVHIQMTLVENEVQIWSCVKVIDITVLLLLTIIVFHVGSRPLLNTDIVIGESDYSSYAVFYYQKQGQLTMKLYGQSAACMLPTWLIPCTNNMHANTMGQYIGLKPGLLSTTRLC